MRLIDADALQEVITQDWFLDILLTQNGKVDIAKRLTDMIDSVPLAYDAEKVVAELEEAKKKNFEAYKEATDTFEILCYGNITNAYGDAIDIVKMGGADLGYNPYQE
jgi:hypothetical protein